MDGYQGGFADHREEEGLWQSLTGLSWHKPPHVRLPSVDAAGEPTAEELQTYRHTIELSSLIPWSCDADGALIRFDRRWHDVTGGTVEAAPQDWAQALHPDELETIHQSWGDALRTGAPLDNEHRLRTRDGTFRWYRTRAAARSLPDGTITRWYGTTEDIHDRKTSELRFEWLAHHDPMTGLPNRTLFQKRVEKEIGNAAATGATLGLLLLDIDGFKQVNDQLGHDAGDRLLAAFAQRMKAILPGIARTGGDEFAILIPRLNSPQQAREIDDLVQEALRIPLGEEFHQIRKVGIGCAIYPLHGQDARELMTSADIALYEAKATLPRKVRIFESGMRRRLQERTSMVSLARHALDHDLVVPFYQSKVDLQTSHIEGFEALLRWHHPRLGYQAPATIEASFQQPDIAVAIGERMWDRVLNDMGRWLAAGVPFGRISINAASAEFSSDDYAERLLERLQRFGIPGSYLEVEVTESVFLGHRGDVVERALRRLNAAGVKIALDDFGTGYACLSHLQRFPVDVMKIDRSFVARLGEAHSDRTIVNALVGMARGLGIETVAEGIECLEQTERLRSYGCAQGQGYWFAHPAPAGEVPKMLASSPAAARKGQDSPIH